MPQQHPTQDPSPGAISPAGPHPLAVMLEARCEAALRLGPAVTARILNAADRAMEGYVAVSSGDAVVRHVGRPTRWRLDPHDDQAISILNRMYQWSFMVRAWRLTGRVAYAHRVVEELRHWMADCPCPLPPGGDVSGYPMRMPPTPWRLLDAGIRMYATWIPSIVTLRDAGVLDQPTYQQALSVCDDHARVLAECVPIDSRPVSTNHLLMEMLGLLYVAVALPTTDRSAAWLVLAQAELCRAADEQVGPDGAQVEGCPHYHNLCLGLFAHAVAVMRMFGREAPARLVEVVTQMADYTLHATRPGGVSVPWGDSDANRSAWEAARWTWVVLNDPAPLRRLRDLCGQDAAEKTLLEGFWDVALEDPASVRSALSESGSPPPLPTHWAGRSVKQASLRTGWSRQDWHVFMGCHLPVYNSHAHADPAGFELSIGPDTPLPDPGRYTYDETQDRRDFKSAYWHNTLTVNRREPFEYINTWAWGPQGTGRLTGEHHDADVQAVACEHDSYQPVTHRRLFTLWRGGGLVIADWLPGLRAQDTVELCFHLDAPGWEPLADGTGITFLAGGRRLVLRCSERFELESLPGRVSPSMDIAHASTRLRMRFMGSRLTLPVVVTQVLEAPADGLTSLDRLPLPGVSLVGAALELERLHPHQSGPLRWENERLDVAAQAGNR